MSDYTVPQIKIHQQFATIPTAVTRNLYAMVFGANYRLFRYSEADEKTLIGAVNATAGHEGDSYDGTAFAAVWPNQPSNSVVDTDYAKVFLDNAQLEYKSGMSCTVGPAANQLTASINLVAAVQGLLDATLPVRGVRVGDTVVIGANSRKVTRLSNVTLPAAQKGVSSGVLAATTTLGGTYDGNRGTTLTLTVVSTGTIGVATGPSVRVTSSSHGDSSAVKTLITSDRTITWHGVTFTYADGATLTADETCVAAYLAASVGPVKVITLDEVLPADGSHDIGDTVSADLLASFNGLEVARVSADDTLNWTADAVTGVTLVSGLALEVPSLVLASGSPISCPVVSADVRIQYRARMLTYTSSIETIEQLSDVETMLGPVHPDNPLAQAAYLCRLNSGARPVYFLATASDSDASWAAAFTKAAALSKAYALVPLSEQDSVLDMASAHVSALSDAGVKKWRIAFVGGNISESVARYTAATNPNEIAYLAKVVNGVLTFVDEDGDIDATVQGLTMLAPGDTIRINYESDAAGADVYDTYTIESVLTNASVKLAHAAAVNWPDPIRVEAYHLLSASETATEVAAVSRALHSRRMYHCYAGKAMTTAGEEVSGMHVAAAVAGLCSSVVPQQGLTNIDVAGFSDLPDMYQTFTSTELDEMAGAGTLLVTQDYANDAIYVRHQVSTAREDGNLNTTELSLVKNLDSISYFFADRLRKYNGSKNITKEMLVALELLINDGLAYLMSNTDVGDIGPQLLGDETKLNSLAQDPVLKDSVNADMDLELPKPFNTANFILRAV